MRDERRAKRQTGECVELNYIIVFVVTASIQTVLDITAWRRTSMSVTIMSNAT